MLIIKFWLFLLIVFNILALQILPAFLTPHKKLAFRQGKPYRSQTVVNNFLIQRQTFS
jgi:hypothetical protein